MAKDAVMVLTSKSLETMIREGGSGDWRAKEDNIQRCPWIIAVRNRHSAWSEGEEDHSTAFLIGRISGVTPSPRPGRLVIQFDQYALLNIPNVWPERHRNPVAYGDLRDFGIDPDRLKWQPFPLESRPKSKSDSPVNLKAEIFDRAKKMIAAALSIDVASVQITITV